MTHLDEGTIHAWLDGALDAAHAAEVSKHAASCAECSALVAEARGFIAGASRILTSLDDAPVGVIPKRAPAVASAKTARRTWQAAPWVTGIAAALILAIGVKEWRERPSAKAAFLPVPEATADSLRAALSRQLSERVRDSNAAPPVKTIQPLIAPPVPAAPTRARQDAAKDALVATTGAVSGGAAAEASPVPPAVRMERRAFTMLDPELGLAGCYRLEPIVLPSSAVAEKAAASVAVAPTAGRAPARKQASGAALAPTAAAVDAVADLAPPSLLRLDTVRSTQGRTMFSATTGEFAGTWRAIDGDSVRLAFLRAGVKTVSTTNRVACPTTP